MPKKEDILAKIDGLVLITEENRTRLKEVVQNLADEQELAVIDELISQEPQIIHDTFQAIIDAELEAGDTSVIQLIDDTLKDLQKEENQIAQEQEAEEKQEDEQAADELLNQME